jgi:hypothetical protein
MMVSLFLGEFLTLIKVETTQIYFNTHIVHTSHSKSMIIVNIYQYNYMIVEKQTKIQ